MSEDEAMLDLIEKETVFYRCCMDGIWSIYKYAPRGNVFIGADYVDVNYNPSIFDVIDWDNPINKEPTK